MLIKTKETKKFELFNSVKIILLKSLSEIDSNYLNYPEEDKEAGSIMEIEYTPSGLYLEQSGRVYLTDNSNVTLIEDVDFKFI